MNDLGSDARFLLEAAEGGDDPSAADAARIREKLARRLPLAAAAAATTAVSTQVAAGSAGAAAGISAGTAAGAGAAGAGLGASAATGSVLALSKKVLVAAVIAGGSVTAGSVAFRSIPEASPPPAESLPDAQPTVSAAPQVARSPEPERAPLLAPLPPPAPEVDDVPNPPSFKPAPALSTPAPTPSPAPSQSTAALPLKVDSVTEEAALLGAAHAALARGDGASALAKLELHATRFPKGALGEERRAARVFALCSLGRVEQARAAAAAFLKQSPGSPLAGQVGRTCANPEREDDFLTERDEPNHP